jgi:alanine racemase
MHFSELEKISGGKLVQVVRNLEVKSLVIDSRKAIIDDGSVFFAIQGPRNDGHKYISDLYNLGLRQFVVEKSTFVKKFPNANFLLVDSAINALQKIASAKRQVITAPVIGITGSNGKTIIKEWLYQLLSPEYSIAKNPGSYNSQIGVPLSVWSMQSFHQLGIFEAGISKPGEMEKLENIIQPSIGVLTNIGTAHDEGFENFEQKINEKLKLFAHTEVLIYCADHDRIAKAVSQKKIKALSWGISENSDIKIKRVDAKYNVGYNENSFELAVPFQDKVSIENSFHCVAMLLHMGYKSEVIQNRLLDLRSVPMRLELKE